MRALIRVMGFKVLLRVVREWGFRVPLRVLRVSTGV